MKPEAILYRQRVLPEQLDRARRRYLCLVREAKNLSMSEILTDPERLSEAWEREIGLAKIEAARLGNPTSMADLCCPEDIDG